MSEPIRISSEEALSSRVDSILAEQQSFGLAAPGELPKKQPLYFKPWFALMLAGMLGGLLAWGIIEPHFDDGLRFSGPIEMVQEFDEPPSKQLSPVWIQMGGARIVIPLETRILTPEGKNLSPRELQAGDSIEVLAGFAEEQQADTLPLGTALHIRKLATPVPQAPVDFEMLSLRHSAVALCLFPLAAALIGLLIGATDGLLSRAWQRALISSSVSLGVGLIGGFIALIPTGIIFKAGQSLALKTSDDQSLKFSGVSLLLLIMGRGLAWAVVGMTAGMGQGIAMRSKRLFVNGIIGGLVGALLGGVFFDPLQLLFSQIYPTGGAEVSRCVGMCLVGAGTGAMIGLVELMARESWVRILTGPIAGKEFILYRNPTWIGSSPKCEIYLFKDPQVAPRHAALHRVGEHYEIEDEGSSSGTNVDGKVTKRTRLRDKSRITIGKTIVEFRVRDE